MPQPHTPSKETNFGPTAISQRPGLAAHIGFANSLWARIDFWLAITVIKAASMSQIRILLQTSHIPLDETKKMMVWQSARVAATMYLSLSGTAAKDAALDQLLGPEDALRFEPIFKKVKSIRKRRNRFAHGIIGVDPTAPDAIIVQDLEDAISKSMGNEESKYYAYKDKDFADLVRDTMELLTELDQFQPTGFQQLSELIARLRTAEQDQHKSPQAPQQTSPQDENTSPG